MQPAAEINKLFLVVWSTIRLISLLKLEQAGQFQASSVMAHEATVVAQIGDK